MTLKHFDFNHYFIDFSLETASFHIASQNLLLIKIRFWEV